MFEEIGASGPLSESDKPPGAASATSVAASPEIMVFSKSPTTDCTPQAPLGM